MWAERDAHSQAAAPVRGEPGPTVTPLPAAVPQAGSAPRLRSAADVVRLQRVVGHAATVGLVSVQRGQEEEEAAARRIQAYVRGRAERRQARIAGDAVREQVRVRS